MSNNNLPVVHRVTHHTAAVAISRLIAVMLISPHGIAMPKGLYFTAVAFLFFRSSFLSFFFYIYPHMPILRPHAARYFTKGASLVPRALAESSDFGLLGKKSLKMGDSLPRTLMNHHAKFDAASFILAGEIRNCTKLQTNKQIVTDISTRAYRHVWIYF